MSGWQDGGYVVDVNGSRSVRQSATNGSIPVGGVACVRGRVDAQPAIAPQPRRQQVRISPGQEVARILYSVVEGSEKIFYVGGDRTTPKELFRLPTNTNKQAAIISTGRGLNKFYTDQSTFAGFTYEGRSAIVESSGKFPGFNFSPTLSTSPLVTDAVFNFWGEDFYLGNGIYQYGLYEDFRFAGGPIFYTKYTYRDGEIWEGAREPIGSLLGTIDTAGWLYDWDSTYPAPTPFPLNLRIKQYQGTIPSSTFRIDCNTPFFIGGGWCVVKRDFYDGGIPRAYTFWATNGETTNYNLPTHPSFPFFAYRAQAYRAQAFMSIAKGFLYHASEAAALSSTDSLQFSTLNLTDGTIATKAIKISPIPKPASLQIHSITYTP